MAHHLSMGAGEGPWGSAFSRGLGTYPPPYLPPHCTAPPGFHPPPFPRMLALSAAAAAEHSLHPPPRVTELPRTHGPEPLGPISVTVPDRKSPLTSEDPRSGLLTTNTGRRPLKRLRSSPEPPRSLDAAGALSSASSGSAEPRSVSPVYPSNSPLPFPPNPAFFSLFLNAPLLQPSQWLYSQLYPHHPYNHFPFRQPPPEDSSDSRKTPPTSPSPVRSKTPTTPPPSSATEAKNTSRNSDVWRPY